MDEEMKRIRIVCGAWFTPGSPTKRQSGDIEIYSCVIRGMVPYGSVGNGSAKVWCQVVKGRMVPTMRTAILDRAQSPQVVTVPI